MNDLVTRWEEATDAGGLKRGVALALPGVAVAMFVIAFVAIAKGSVSSGAVTTAVFGFFVFTGLAWRQTEIRRTDRRTAGELFRQLDVQEPVEFASRQHGNLWSRNVWIATDRRLIEASPMGREGAYERPSVLQSIDYNDLSAIRSVRTRGGGQRPRITTIVFVLASQGELKLRFGPTKARALLEVVRAHAGLPQP